MKPTRQPGRPVALAGLALAGLLLSGCGSLAIHPGAAVVAGDRSVSMHTVDSTASLACQAFLPALQSSQTQQIPQGWIRQNTAQSLAEGMIADQLAQTYHVEPGPGYDRYLSSIKQQFAQAPADARAAILKVADGSAKLHFVQVAVGQKLLAASGQPAGQQAAAARGKVATQDWLKSHTVQIDPVYGLAVQGDQIAAVKDQTSYPLSPLAALGAKTDSQHPNADYTSSLPPSQLCG